MKKVKINNQINNNSNNKKINNNNKINKINNNSKKVNKNQRNILMKLKVKNIMNINLRVL